MSQIRVKATASPVVMSESTKVVLIAGLAVVADRFMTSDTAIVAVLAAGGALATFAWGLWVRLTSWRALRFLAGQVGDEVAVVGKGE